MKFETLEELEKNLGSLSIKQADKSFQLKNELILKELKEQKRSFNWLYALAFSLAASVMVNVYQFTQSQPNKASKNLVAQNNNAQNTSGGYSLVQGGLVPYSGKSDTVIIWRNEK